MRFRGFKDHGLEGKMRIAIHHIEKKFQNQHCPKSGYFAHHS